MKKLFYLFLLLGGVLFMSSCGDDENVPGDNYVRLSVDGTNYEQTQLSVSVSNQFGTEAISIVAPLTDYSLLLNLPTSAQVGSSVSFDAISASTSITFSSPSATFFPEGEYTVTSHDTNSRIMTGTFSFDALAAPFDTTPALVITNGEFSVNY